MFLMQKNTKNGQKRKSLMQRRLHQKSTSEDNTEDDSMHNTMQTSGADDQISPALYFCWLVRASLFIDLGFP